MQLTQIVPMFDEETGEEGPAIVKARILDPYVILLRADRSMVVYKLDKSMELAEEGKENIKVNLPKCLSYDSLIMHRVPNSNPEVSTRLEKEGSFPQQIVRGRSIFLP
jgi:hypothetical protein